MAAKSGAGVASGVVSTLIGPEKIVVVVNMDALSDIHLGLDPRVRLEKQISADTLAQFDLGWSECGLLSAALVLALRGAHRSPDAVRHKERDQQQNSK